MDEITKSRNHLYARTSLNAASDLLILYSMVVYFRATRDGNWAESTLLLNRQREHCRKEIANVSEVGPVCAISREFLIDVDPLDLSMIQCSVVALHHDTLLRAAGLNGCTRLIFYYWIKHIIYTDFVREPRDKLNFLLDIW